MSFVEVEDKLGNRDGSEAPAFGNPRKVLNLDKEEAEKRQATKIRIKYFVANMSDLADKQTVEDIMSASLDCQDSPKKPGDIAVIKEETNFDRDGNYNVLIKYLELVETKRSTLDTKPKYEKTEAIKDEVVESIEETGESVLDDLNIDVNSSELPKHDF
jgi:hypothetical protein